MKISHPIIKKYLKNIWEIQKKLSLQIAVDVPAELAGSSGAFTVAVIKSLYTFKNNSIGHEELAERSCEIEIKDLKRNVGKQDQYSSVYGGINSYKFSKVEVVPLKIKNTIEKLEDNLCLYFTKFSRSAIRF